MSRVFIDTNVLVYSVDKRDAAKREIARRCLERVRVSGEGVISTQVLQEFFVVATRKLRIAPQTASCVIDELPPLEVTVVDVALVRQAMEVCIRNQLSFWDALIVVSARRARCEVIWTEDLSHGQMVDSVRIENPFLEEKETGQNLVREVGAVYGTGVARRRVRRVANGGRV